MMNYNLMEGSLKHYRLTAQAIGLIELRDNEYPSSKQNRIVERVIEKLQGYSYSA